MKKDYFTRISLACLLCLLILLPGCCCLNIGDWGKEEYAKTEKVSAPIPDGATLVIENQLGTIAITGADVTDCNVTARISARAPSEEEAAEIAKQVKIRLVPEGNTLTVKADKPHFGKKRSVTINYEVTVPRQTALQLESNMGQIEVSNIAASIRAETDIGTITCEEISGDIDLAADIGEITVVYSKNAPAVCNATIKTNIGKINFTAPPNFSATIDAAANIGSIETDLPLSVTGKIGKELHGTIGEGEGALNLKTDVGEINIR
ncbi:MAG: DUF4097 family beta strand repeat-containing protein [Planctomycetota bacterium]|jgi:hypothetical protein